MKSFSLIMNRCCCLLVLSTLTPSSVSAIPSYNETQLRNYARLCQQIRAEMFQLIGTIVTRITNLETALVDARTEVNHAAANSILATASHNLQNICDAAKTNYADAMMAWTENSYTNTNDFIYTNLKLQHGMSYNTETTELTIYKDGAYLVEIDLQPTDDCYFTMEFEIHQPGDMFIISDKVVFYKLYACYTFTLTRGDVIKFKTLLGYEENWPAPASWLLQRAEATQVRVRYLGASA